MKVTVVGGCGHVGLPLSVALGLKNHEVIAFDISETSVKEVNLGRAPFWEPGLSDSLNVALNLGFIATTDAKSVASAEVVIVIVGTPIDLHLNPDPNAVVAAVEEIASDLNDNQLLVLRSTVFPGVTQQVERLLANLGIRTPVVFCPERIAEGFAMQELSELPQIIGARSDENFKRAADLFESLGVKTIRNTPEEAELAKLFTNTWRYIKFAAANQFWLMPNDATANRLLATT